MTIKLTLNKSIERSNGALTKNNISVTSQIRSNTLSDLANGSSRSIRFDTLDKILIAMNTLDDANEYTVSDILIFEDEKER